MAYKFKIMKYEMLFIRPWNDLTRRRAAFVRQGESERQTVRKWDCLVPPSISLEALISRSQRQLANRMVTLHMSEPETSRRIIGRGLGSTAIRHCRREREKAGKRTRGLITINRRWSTQIIAVR